MCQDKVVSYLNTKKYNAILSPREQFDPLMVLGGDHGDLKYLGDLSDLVASEVVMPPIARDDQEASFSGRKTDKLEAKVGIDLLSRLFHAFGGGTVKATAQDQQSGGFEIVLMDVLHDFVAPLKVASYMAKAKPLDGVSDTLSAYKNIYLVSETLKSNQFGIVAFDGIDAGAQLSAEALQGLISASASIQVTKGSGGSMCYKGNKHLRFAFRALPLIWSATDGSIKLGVDDKRLVARYKDETPLDVFSDIAPKSLIDLQFG